MTSIHDTLKASMTWHACAMLPNSSRANTFFSTYSSYSTTHIHYGCSTRPFLPALSPLSLSYTLLPSISCLLAQVSPSLSFLIYFSFPLFLFSLPPSFYILHTETHMRRLTLTDRRRTIFRESTYTHKHHFLKELNSLFQVAN